jgi:hypothetical protein
MKNNRRTKRNNRRSNKRGKNGGAFPMLSRNAHFSLGIKDFLFSVQHDLPYLQQSEKAKRFLDIINEDNSDEQKGINRFLIKDLKGLKDKCNDDDLKQYVNNVQTVIDAYPDDLVKPDAKHILKSHLSLIGCPADINAELKRLHEKISFGGRKTRRQKK